MGVEGGREMSYQLLIVEDDLFLQEAIADYFQSKSWEVTCVSSGIDAINMVRKMDFHIILLDIMIPKQNGFQVCEKIRKSKDVPIIFITARVSEEDKLNGYSKGADDYVTKPFSLPVLYAKSMALVARALGSNVIHELSVGDITVDTKARSVKIGQNICCLPPKEYDILIFLMENPKRIFTREQLLIRFWGYDFEGNERVVDNHIKKLRKNLGICSGYIKTVTKVGYKLEVT